MATNMVVATKQKPKTTPVHRKRTGQHQKRGTHFTKAYWPYIPIGLIIAVGILVNSLYVQPHVLSYATDMTPGGLLQGTNAERAKHGIGTLALNASLMDAAQAKAQDMAARNYWSHTTPDGLEPWKFINDTGYLYLAAGENLAYGFSTSDQAVIGWINSPGHRANILNGDYAEVGFGVVNSADYQKNGEQTIVVALYAKPATTNALGSAATSEPDAQSAGNQQIAIAQSQSTTDKLAVSAVVPGPRKVAHVQMATSGAAPWTMLAASSLAILLTMILVARHSLAWHRVVVRGEKFFLKHKLLDTIVVATVVAMAIMTQTAGFIQ